MRENGREEMGFSLLVVVPFRFLFCWAALPSLQPPVALKVPGKYPGKKKGRRMAARKGLLQFQIPESYRRSHQSSLN